MFWDLFFTWLKIETVAIVATVWHLRQERLNETTWAQVVRR